MSSAERGFSLRSTHGSIENGELQANLRYTPSIYYHMHQYDVHADIHV